MDDLALLKDMADRTPLPTSADLAPARARLTAAFTQEDEQMTTQLTAASTGKEPARSTEGRPRRRRRLVVSAVAVVGMAAAITGVVALGGLEEVGVAPPKASAAEILHQAADAAREQPATPPRPDQFVYTRSQNTDGSVREAWLSADGTHDGLISQGGENIPVAGCRDGQEAVIKGTEPIPGAFQPCEPSPAYVPDLPTDAAGMRAYLEELSHDPKDRNSVNKNIHFVTAETYVSPESLAALFEALSAFPGLTIDEQATDGAGRPGVGVSWTSPGQGKKPFTMTLVFDPKTHTFLGISDWNAVLERGVVDTAGQRP
jgi:hypothetical protein